MNTFTSEEQYLSFYYPKRVAARASQHGDNIPGSARGLDSGRLGHASRVRLAREIKKVLAKTVELEQEQEEPSSG